MSRLLRFATSLLVVAALPFSSVASASPTATHAPNQQRALHLLDRFTFGPVPGQVPQVARDGVYTWFDEQLHPVQIDESALDARLADYPSVALPVSTLLADYPSPPEVRRALNGRVSPPATEPQSAVWQSQMARILQKRAQPNHAQQPAMLAAPQTTPDADSLIRMEPESRYAALLQLQPDSMPRLVQALAPRQRSLLIKGFTPTQRDTVLALINPRLVVLNQEESARLLRDIYSRRQVERVMTEFWLNHFNIAAAKSGREPYYLAQFEQGAVAPHALGRFEDLLDAVAESPAMLLYLDNAESIGPNSQVAHRRDHTAAPDPQTKQSTRNAGINENYGRELMELHTVGVNGGYTQQDVIEAAKVLTGWTVAPPRQGGGFRFAANLHEPGEKVVMGHAIPAGGQQEGLQLLHILASSPATARLLSTQLAVRFVSDNPPPALIASMVHTYLTTDGDIAAVLETMVHAPQFWSGACTGNKVKTPLDYVASAVRATGAEVTEPFRLVSELRAMGMPLTGTQEPNGYAMTNDAWASSSALVARLNFSLALAFNRIPGVTVPPLHLEEPGGSAATPHEQAATLEQMLLGGVASPQVNAVVVHALSDPNAGAALPATLVLTGYKPGTPFSALQQPAAKSDSSLSLATGLLLGSPAFQRR